MKNRLLLLLNLTVFIYACSGDDQESNDIDINSVNWDVQVLDITATTFTYDVSGSFGGNTVSLGYRKVGATEFISIPDSGSGREISALEPLTAYEIRVFKNNEVSSKKVVFNTLPFDITFGDDSNHIIRPGSYVSSSEGFEHAIALENISSETNDISARLIPVEDGNENILVDHIEIKDDSLYFSIPKEIISNVPFVPYTQYYLECTVGQETFVIKEKSYLNSEIYQTVFMVYNDTPYIESINVGSGFPCEGIDQYYITFEGYFMSIIESQAGYVKNDQINAIVTRLDNNTISIIPYYNGNGDQCGQFVRTLSLSMDVGTLPNYHSNRNIVLERLKSEHDLHPGDYKIRFTFEKGEEFYETNEFFFTIEE